MNDAAYNSPSHAAPLDAQEDAGTGGATRAHPAAPPFLPAVRVVSLSRLRSAGMWLLEKLRRADFHPISPIAFGQIKRAIGPSNQDIDGVAGLPG